MAGDGNGLWNKLRGLLPGRRNLREVPLRSMTSDWLEVQHMLTQTHVSATSYRFDPDDCNVLVVYALVDSPPDPSPRSPSFVYGFAPDAGRGVLGADRAPSITLVDFAGMEADIEQARAHANATRTAERNLNELIAWVHEIGDCYYGYQLEPPAICGGGTARARGVEWSESPVEPQEAPRGADVALPNTEPWPRAASGFQCPRCTSTDTASQYTTALGNRFTEARCNTCGHYDSWFDG